MSGRQLLEAFTRWQFRQLPLTLVTVVDTSGSTYTKAGHRILMAANGEFQGLISGGCLEGDLAEHARRVLTEQRAALVTYDLRGERDELFGLGVGCDGMMRLLLQPLLPAAGYAPFAGMAAVMAGEFAAVIAIVYESATPAVPLGATVLVTRDHAHGWQVNDDWRERLAVACRTRPAAAPASSVTLDADGAPVRALLAPLRPVPQLLVLGAALDAVPLAAMAQQLGWRVTVADHRGAYLERGDFAGAELCPLDAPAGLATRLPLARFSAAIVMSHHLATDRALLGALAASTVPFIGLLGPAGCRDRLLGELGANAARLSNRLHAPAGMAIGADSPASIALAILAEIQASGVARYAGDWS